jgi:succinate dehydrogenase / fumarate reductase cytochrome b subunit
MTDAQKNRPLSPHLAIYRWQITNTLSILHRMTGFGLALGLIPLSLWLWGAAHDAALFSAIQSIFHSWVGKFALFAWILSFYYHLGNGMRHLNWDMGKGFNLNDVTSSGQVVVAFALAMTFLTILVAAQKMGMI